MPDKIEEVEPQTNPTPAEETPKEPEEAPTPPEEPNEAPKPDEPTEKEKRLYARLKKSEAKNEKLEQGIQDAKKQADPNDVDKILAVQTATKGLIPEEIAELKLRADATGQSLVEARNDENFKLWRKAYKIKVEEEKVPSPSTKQDPAKPEVKDFNSLKTDERKEALANMSDDEREAWLDTLTVNGVKIEDMVDKRPGRGNLGISPEGLAAFKKEKEPKPAGELPVGENPQLR